MHITHLTRIILYGYNIIRNSAGQLCWLCLVLCDIVLSSPIGVAQYIRQRSSKAFTFVDAAVATSGFIHYGRRERANRRSLYGVNSCDSSCSVPVGVAFVILIFAGRSEMGRDEAERGQPCTSPSPGRASGRPGRQGQLAREAARPRVRRHATKVIYIAVGNGEKYGGVQRRRLSIMR